MKRLFFAAIVIILGFIMTNCATKSKPITPETIVITNTIHEEMVEVDNSKPKAEVVADYFQKNWHERCGGGSTYLGYDGEWMQLLLETPESSPSLRSIQRSDDFELDDLFNCTGLGEYGKEELMVKILTRYFRDYDVKGEISKNYEIIKVEKNGLKSHSLIKKAESGEYIGWIFVRDMDMVLEDIIYAGDVRDSRWKGNQRTSFIAHIQMDNWGLTWGHAYWKPGTTLRIHKTEMEAMTCACKECPTYEKKVSTNTKTDVISGSGGKQTWCQANPDGCKAAKITGGVVIGGLVVWGIIELINSQNRAQESDPSSSSTGGQVGQPGTTP